MRSHICITGGAGYIGSHTVWALRDQKIPVVVFDNLLTGQRNIIPDDVPLVVGDIRDEDALVKMFKTHNVRAVVHCAGLSGVTDSVHNPGEYWSVNAGGTATLTTACRKAGVMAIVYASSAAVYGEPTQLPVPENHPLEPSSPYGRSKVAAEQILKDSHAAGGPNWLTLRYFNASGADRRTRVGECHNPETHIIPLILKASLALMNGSASPRALQLNGNNYPTRDGSCERDYIHVSDIAEAHSKCLDYLLGGGRSGVFNIGSGQGVTVRELFHHISEITGRPVPYNVSERRPGDPARLVADTTMAWQFLGWKPNRSSLDNIIRTALAWEQKQAQRDLSTPPPIPQRSGEVGGEARPKPPPPPPIPPGAQHEAAKDSAG